MTLTPEQMRELADALNRIARSHAMIAPAESEAQDRAADFLRQCAQAEPVAWMHDDDSRVISNETMQGAIQDGGAILSSLRGYTIPLYERPQPAQPPEGWQWVPVEPTQAMLSAAPTPPAQADVREPTEAQIDRATIALHEFIVEFSESVKLRESAEKILRTALAAMERA